MSTCSWTALNENTGEILSCRRSATHNQHCIFRAKKDQKDADEFRQRLSKEINGWRKQNLDEWNFCGFVFPERIFADNLVPSSKFKSTVRFIFAEFHDIAGFNAAHFHGEAQFGQAQFHSGAWFDRATFQKSSDFERAQFHEYVTFRSTQFHGTTNFAFVHFYDNAYFETAEFRKNASLESAQFDGNARFHGAQFHGQQTHKDAWYYGVPFRGDFVFESTSFAADSDFSSTSFRNCWLQMSNCSFARFGNFSGCSIEGRVKIVWPGKGKKRVNDKLVPRGTVLLDNLQFQPNSRLDLRENDLSEDVNLMVRHCDMVNILLLGTNCTRVQFYASKWGSERDILFRGLVGSKRDVVGDEAFYRRYRKVRRSTWQKPRHKEKNRKPPWGLIRQSYLQLAKQFREHLDHPRANEFDRGAFEMRRLEAKNEGGLRGWSTYIWLSCYKYVSHYSGNLLLPVIWFALATVTAGIVYNCWIYGKTWFNSDGLTAAIRVLAMHRLWLDDVIKDATEKWAPQVIILTATFQIVITAVLVTLFVLSIRRRFKH